MVLEPSGAVHDALTSGLGELLAGRGITDTQLADVVARYPAFLSPEGLKALSDLAAVQPDADARETLERLHAILMRATAVGIAAAAAEFRVDLPTVIREQRLERQRHQLVAARRARPIRAPHGPDATLRAKGLVFDSLAECRSYLVSHYPQGTIEVNGKEVSSHPETEGQGIQWQAPRFFFRGESGLYATTQTSLTRLVQDLSLSVETIETVIALSLHVRGRLIDQLGLSPRLAVGLLQHYGMPTHFFDVTPDLEVAVGFATDLCPGDWGAIAVLPMESLLQDQQSIMLAELTHHPMAIRPQRQQAFAYMDYVHSDLKDPGCIADRGLVWHWFRFTDDDEQRQQPRPYLLDARSDGVAGLIELFLNDMARFDDGAAHWLSTHVPAAPTVMRMARNDAGELTGLLVPLDELDEALLDSSQTTNYRYWSQDHGAFDLPATTTDRLDLPLSDAGALTEGAIVWVLRSHVLQQPRSDG